MVIHNHVYVVVHVVVSRIIPETHREALRIVCLRCALEAKWRKPVQGGKFSTINTAQLVSILNLGYECVVSTDTNLPSVRRGLTARLVPYHAVWWAMVPSQYFWAQNLRRNLCRPMPESLVWRQREHRKQQYGDHSQNNPAPQGKKKAKLGGNSRQMSPSKTQPEGYRWSNCACSPPQSPFEGFSPCSRYRACSHPGTAEAFQRKLRANKRCQLRGIQIKPFLDAHTEKVSKDKQGTPACRLRTMSEKNVSLKQHFRHVLGPKLTRWSRWQRLFP